MAIEMVRDELKPRTLEWQVSTVVKVKIETPTVKTFTMALPEWVPHKAGQHYDIRLTAPDGYQTQRSYSIASSAETQGVIDLTIERLDDGEVSTYLHDVLIVGDHVELRGPIGGYFVWDSSMGGPLLLVAGGSGIVPLMAMLRHRQASGSEVPARLLYSTHSLEDVIYREELDEMGRQGTGVEVFHTLTRQPPPGWKGFRRRIDLRMLEEMVKPFAKSLLAYVCGPTALVEATASGLAELGVPAGHIRTERFGPTGGG